MVTDLGTLGGAAMPFAESPQVPSPFADYATAVSGNIVVGNASTASNELHAFAYDLGAASPTMRDLGSFGGSARALTGADQPGAKRAARRQ